MGLGADHGALIFSGLLYVALSTLIRFRGTQIILRILPPIVTGPVIIVIGLVLAPVAVKMALGLSGEEQSMPRSTALIIAMSSLLAIILVPLLGRGLLRLIPILCGIVVGLAVSMGQGVCDWTSLHSVPWIAMPEFTLSQFAWEPMLFIIPITVAPAIEHFGDIIAISSVTGKDLFKDPGIKNTMLGDGLATMCACALVFRSDAGLQSGRHALGGIMILLFGAIMVVGLNTLARAGHDLLRPSNMVIVALIIILGVDGMQFDFGSFKLGGRPGGCDRRAAQSAAAAGQTG